MIHRIEKPINVYRDTFGYINTLPYTVTDKGSYMNKFFFLPPV